MYAAAVTSEGHVGDEDLVSDLGPYPVFKVHGLIDLGDWCCHLGPWRHPGTELLLGPTTLDFACYAGSRSPHTRGREDPG